MIWSARGLLFRRLFGSLFRPKRENEKVCLDCTGVCGLHIQLSGKCTFSQLFSSFFLKPCAGGHFDSILVFWGLPRGTLGHHFGGRGCKKMRSEKMMQKVFKNGCAGCAGKTVPGAVGPLKTDNPPVDCSQQDTGSNTPCRA